LVACGLLHGVSAVVDEALLQQVGWRPTTSNWLDASSAAGKAVSRVMGFDSGNDLERLLARCRLSDSDAWSALVAAMQSVVYSVPRRYNLNADDSEDVFQITFLALYRNLDRITSAQALPRWLAVTAARESLRIARLRNTTVSSEDLGVSLDDILAEEDASAESMSIAAESAFRVRKGVSDLPARCRDLLTMLYIEEDAQYAEIAGKLKMPVGAIGPTRARCLDKLRKILGNEGFFE
jgi:RNA polymerase sigma factor (sigma-70 family)